MERIVQKGKTLLVDGPASVRVLSGKTGILGANLEAGEKIVIREGKRIPFNVKKVTTFSMMLGEGAFFEVINGKTIPYSWEKAVKKVLSSKRPLTVLVIGGVDSGKSSFCTYLINETLSKGWKAAIIDADLGQSDVGPPATIGLKRVVTPIRDLFDVEVDDAYFVGVTSPSIASSKIVEGLEKLESKAAEAEMDLVVINTDGWVEGKDAVEHKIHLTERVSPELVLVANQGDELTPIISALDSRKIYSIAYSNGHMRRRNREIRRNLRELSYKKYLKQGRTKSFDLSFVNIEGATFGIGNTLANEVMEKITSMLGMKPIYTEETPTTLFVVLRKNQTVDEKCIETLEENWAKPAKVIKEGEEEGLLVGLFDEQKKFLGIGVICKVDYKRKAVKIYTPVGKSVASIHFSQIKISKSGREIGLSTAYAKYAP